MASGWVRSKENSNTNLNNTCRSIVTKVPPKTPLSYFINIPKSVKKSSALHDPLGKVRIKIPKLLAKTVKKKVDADSENKNTKNWDSPKIHFPSKVISLLSNVFASKKYLTSSQNVGNDDSSHYPFSLGPKSPIWDFGVSKENQKIEEERVKQSWFIGKSGKRICMACKQPLKEKVPSSSLLGFFNKMSPLNFTEGKNSNDSTSYSDRSSDKGKGWRSISMARARFTINLKGKRVYSSKKKVIRTSETDDEEGDGKELWKKRILMGERCRPLNFSGSLHYDENGNPITELLAKPDAGLPTYL